MKTTLLLLLSTFVLLVSAKAQDFPFGEFSEQEISMKHYDKDSSAHAVVLREFGKTYISSGDRIPLEHEYHVKIKLFDSKAFNQGDVKLYTYIDDNNSFESISDIKAVTYYLDNNGNVQRSELNPKQVFYEKKNKHYTIVKFAMPNLRNGCIIEYSYKLSSPFRFNFKTWEFQSDIPKIYSEYEAHIPAIYNYNVSLRGFLKLSKTKADLDRECFQMNGIKADCSKIIYAMNDVPAFVEEDYMTAPKNFMSALYFELADYTDLSTGVKRNVTKEWKDVDYSLKTNEYFGSQMKRKALMKERIQPVIAGKTDALEKAKVIYAYIIKNIKWNGFYTKYSEDGIKTALDKHSGTIGDVNLALIAALSAADIPTEAVILSTRNHGMINKLFPVESDFDYVIAKVNIGEKSYLLDATDPLLPFGLLPMRCINDQGRVMSLDKPSYWTDLTANQKNSRTYLLDLTLQATGKLTGTVTHYSFGYEAYEKRLAIKKFNSTDEYVENLDSKMPKTKIFKFEIQNLDSLELPLSERYEVEISAYDNLERSRISFNPFIMDKLTENPFKLAERTYPVDMGNTSDTRTVLTLHLPDNFILESAPQPVSFGMPNKGGMFMTGYTNENGIVTFSHVTQLTHSVYAPEEYPYLKELFNKIIQSEKSELIFHKKS